MTVGDEMHPTREYARAQYATANIARDADDAVEFRQQTEAERDEKVAFPAAAGESVDGRDDWDPAGLRGEEPRHVCIAAVGVEDGRARTADDSGAGDRLVDVAPAAAVHLRNRDAILPELFDEWMRSVAGQQRGYARPLPVPARRRRQAPDHGLRPAGRHRGDHVKDVNVDRAQTASFRPA